MNEEMALTESEIYAMAVGLLARREHSAKELATKLQCKGGAVESVESVLSRLIEERLQSDARYTESYVRQRSGKGYGPLRISAELRERGIDEGLVSSMLRRAEEEGDVDWFEMASAAYAKKYGGRPIEDIRERAKRMRFMQYRGFSQEQIAVAIESE